jgi:opacity protein-like surface antigen
MGFGCYSGFRGARAGLALSASTLSAAATLSAKASATISGKVTDGAREIYVFTLRGHSGRRPNCHQYSSVDYLSIHSSVNYGFNAGAGILAHLFGEFMFNRQTTGLSAHHSSDGSLVTLTNNAHLDLYQFSLLYEFPTTNSQLLPFVVAGIGDEHFDSHGILSFSDRFAYNLGGGAKYLLTPQIALRAEMRWSPFRTTSSSTTFCDPSLGCFTTPIMNHAQQGQADIGVEFWF